MTKFQKEIVQGSSQGTILKKQKFGELWELKKQTNKKMTQTLTHWAKTELFILEGLTEGWIVATLVLPPLHYFHQLLQLN